MNIRKSKKEVLNRNNLEKSKKKKKSLFYYLFLILIFVFFLFFLALKNTNEFWDKKSAEDTIKHLKELRVALENYYQKYGKYPDLTREGAGENLNILDYYDENGEFISFVKFYGKEKLAATSKSKSTEETNKVIDAKAGMTGKGGWIYDYSGQTGEIHANLPDNSYGFGIIWKEY